MDGQINKWTDGWTYGWSAGEDRRRQLPLQQL